MNLKPRQTSDRNRVVRKLLNSNKNNLKGDYGFDGDDDSSEVFHYEGGEDGDDDDDDDSDKCECSCGSKFLDFWEFILMVSSCGVVITVQGIFQN